MPIAPERCRLVFDKLERDLLKLSSKRDPENVHGFRTGIRRVQTLLEDLVPDPDRNRKKLLKQLDRLRKRAGKVRDLDVQLAALRSLKTPEQPRRKTQLTQSLIEARAEHEKKLRKSLSQETVREIRKRLNKAGKGLNLKTARDPLTAAMQVLEMAQRPGDPPSEEVLHRYRILTKRARYIAEFMPKSPQSTHFIAQLRRVQDALGDWHDWLMLTQSASERLGDLQESSLVAALHNVTGAKSRRAVAALSSSRSTQASPKPMKRQQAGTRAQTASRTMSAA
jgi:CHAD domain-containing protein